MNFLSKIAIIAGNGNFPIESSEEAKKRGIKVYVVAIKGETEREIEKYCDDIIWVGLGDFGKLFSFLKKNRVSDVILAGQVKHVKIFSRDFPDFKALRYILSLKRQDTSSLLGGFIKMLEKEGYRVLDSTIFLKKYIPEKGILTKRKPTEEEIKDIEYGFKIAKEISKLDIGQTVVVRNLAVVAVEAMEGTDETIKRAHKLSRGKKLRLIKVARPKQDMRFDVPVLGPKSLKVLKECNVSTICIESGKTLILNLEKFIEELDKNKISLIVK